MPITIQEERGGRVSLWTFTDPFTTNELSDSIDNYQQTTLDNALKKVYLICDFTRVRHLPPNIMSAGLKMAKKQHPMSGPVIEVSSNGFMNAIVSAFAKLTPNMMTVCKTMPEAFEAVDRMIALETEEKVKE